ncbi:MAG: hypothetical protein BWY87_01444 [Deltaproteobacteria bacterium ADurb.Bin510]|nr:MAG: hypothetical protein BWY87_01444 [Deltaproteobacteria bacterium ADurb.Bin510]
MAGLERGQTHAYVTKAGAVGLKLLAGLIEPAAVLVALGFELPEGLLARLQTGEQFGLLA